MVRVGPTPDGLGGTLGARLPERKRELSGEGVLLRKWLKKLDGGAEDPGEGHSEWRS